MSIALIHLSDEGYVVSFHEFKGAPAYAKEVYSSIDNIMSKYADYNWRHTQADELMGSALFIGC